MSYEVIEFYARRKPLAKALIDADGTEYTYLEVCRELSALIKKITGDLPRILHMQPVAISHRNRRLHLLMMFALEAIGVTSLPFLAPIDPGFEKSLQLCGLVLAEERIDGVDRPFFELSPAWFKNAFATSANAPDIASWHADQVTVMLTTSGSSGAAKAIPLHRSAFEVRERVRISEYALGETSIFLLALPPSMFSISLSVRATLRCGGTVLIWGDDLRLDVLRVATHLTLLPGNLPVLLDRLAGTDLKATQLQVMSVGAPLSQRLRERARQVLGAQVANRYGSNELGACLAIGSDNIGGMVPGTQLQVVDDNLEAVQHGEPGMVRGRSQGMARRYVDQQQTQERFKDGWFLTGDLGRMRGYRQLELLGRSDEMLNLGGIKIAPERVEESLSQSGIGRDLAVCHLDNANGIAVLHILIAQPLCDAATMQRQIQQTLSANFGEVRVLMVERIPRAANGKLLRGALKEMVLGHLKT